jgi:signal transduction histidine kinase
MRLSPQSREAAVIEERNRMARDIHDTLAQGFTGVIVQLEAAKGAVARLDFADIETRIERASELAKSSLREARRSVLALRLRSLQDGTLPTALNDLLRRMTDGTPLHAELRVSGRERAIPMDWEENLLRIAQEALTNTIKYAHALTFHAVLAYGLQEVQLRLTDDGRGFDTEAQHEGLGLIGMRERADRIAGRFVIRSTRGGGAEIRVILRNPARKKVE